MKQEYIEKVRDNVENFSEMSDKQLQDLQEQSLFTEKEFVAYVLTRPSVYGVTGSDVADLLDVEENTVWSKTDRCKKKIQEAQKTILVDSVFDE